MNELHTLRYVSTDDQGMQQYTSYWLNFVKDTSEKSHEHPLHPVLREDLRKRLQ